MTTDAIVESIARAAERLRGSASELASAAGLSTEGTAWAIDTTVASLSREALREGLETLRSLQSPRVERQAMVLAGNVLTSGLRPLTWSFLAGVPVRVKLASSDAGLTERFRDALLAEAVGLGESVTIERFSRASTERYEALVEGVETVQVYGDDDTIETLRARTPQGVRFVAHGQGLGLAVIARDAETDDALFDALALDVAAYDQHGCLSPKGVLVEEGGAVSPELFAERLHAALGRIEARLPRGPLGDLGPAETSWRSIAAALGALHEGPTHAVSFEGTGPIRESPGHRNVAVHSLRDMRQLAARVAPYGEHLKALGTAGSVLVPATVTPVVSPLGQMQTPSLMAWMDGLAPWTGLVVEPT